MNVFVKDLFSKYFALQSKAQLSEPEVLLQSTIVGYFRDIKKTIMNNESRDLLETSQLIFVLPIEWEDEACQNDIRTLFCEAGWITHQDGKNKLIFSPFLEVMVDYLQKSSKFRKQFVREGKYMFCYVRAGYNDSEVLFNSICFQMQNAKEMIAISKTLASSDFMLVPTIKSSKTISLSNTNQIVRNIVKQLIAESKPQQATRDVVDVRRRSRLSFLKKPFKIHHNHSRNAEVNALRDVTEATMSELSGLYKTYSRYGADEPWIRDTVNCKLRKKEFKEYLSNLTCGRLFTEIWDDINVRQFLEQVGDSIKFMLDQYDTVEGSPDGIRDVILHKCNPRIKNVSCTVIEDALTERVLKDADILQWRNAFIDTPRVADVCASAMLKPIKMIQVANAVLPPIIMDQRDNDDASSSSRLCISSNELIAPNTYYAQVLINKQHIDFILNKVVKVASTLENPIQMFTALEKRIEMADILETTLGNMWDHYRSLDLGTPQAGMLKRCSQNHGELELSLRNYRVFRSNLKKMMKIWFSNTSSVAKNEPDSYQLVSIDETCDCALKISHRMLLEIGLKPAIKSMASTIVGTLISNDSFGLYYIPTIIIITGSIMENVFFSFHAEQCLEESIQNCFYIHQRKPALYFHNDKQQANCELMPYLRSGSYSQLSSTSYIAEFHDICYSDSDNIIIGTQQEKDSFSRKLNIENHEIESTFDVYTSRFSAESSLLRRGDVLRPEGTSQKFLIRSRNSIRVDIIAVDTTSKAQTEQRIWSEELSWPRAPSHLVTISISPVNHSSTVQINVSYLREVYFDKVHQWGLGDIIKSINVHERLHLKVST
ncbi:hypothetical protein MBANPS3_007952 [Mucor bainieri]